MDSSVHVRVNLQGSGCTHVKTPLDAWGWHPTDPSIDLAIVPFDVPDEMDLQYLPIEMFVNPDLIEKFIGFGDEVFITGLFTSHFGAKKNRPIVRIGNIAAMPEEPVETKWSPCPMEAFIIEARSIGGLSGSPVFVHVPPRGSGKRDPEAQGTYEHYLLGLIHGHFDLAASETDFEEPESASADNERGDRPKGLHSGLAIVTPATKILEVLSTPTFKAERERVVEEKLAPFKGVPDARS
jgi:hypothetical protein